MEFGIHRHMASSILFSQRYEYIASINVERPLMIEAVREVLHLKCMEKFTQGLQQVNLLNVPNEM